jgi:hypothetical protein
MRSPPGRSLAPVSGENGGSRSAPRPWAGNRSGVSGYDARVPARIPILLAVSFLASGLWAAHAAASAGSSAFDPGRSSVALRLKGYENPYRVQFTTAMPGDTLAMEAVGIGARRGLTARATGGRIEAIASDRWRFLAPQEPGQCSIQIGDGGGAEPAIRLTVFVLKPYARSQALDGYRIGRYADPPEGCGSGEQAAYAAPRGFVEVTRDNAGTLVTPHFRLEQFVCKQTADFPKFVALNERLLLKLEAILEQLNLRGVAAHTLQIMSGFRTPFYNRAIGNRTTLSRHHYGDAADIYVDEDGDGKMDDLNGDRLHDNRDAAFLRDVALAVDTAPDLKALEGGLSLYAETPHRGSMVHVDTRGRPARW